MKSIVVYESHWGNTAAVARAIAEGIGPEARALSTDEATPAIMAEAELVVAGAPLLGFSLPTEAMLQNIAGSAATNPVAPDVSHPSLRSWLDALPAGHGHAAAFETRIWWSPGSAAKAILRCSSRARRRSNGCSAGRPNSTCGTWSNQYGPCGRMPCHFAPSCHPPRNVAVS